MYDFGIAVEMETDHAFFDQAIGICNSLVLAQMLRPRRDEESLDDASIVGGIFEYAPAIGTVAAPFISELCNGMQKLLPILRTNAVFHCDEDWPHAEPRFPESADRVLAWQNVLSAEAIRKMMWDNPVRFFGEP